MRKNYSGKFKAKVAVEVIKEQNTISEVASKYEVHRSMLTRWKKEALEGLPNLFSTAQKDRKESHNTHNHSLGKRKLKLRKIPVQYGLD